MSLNNIVTFACFTALWKWNRVGCSPLGKLSPLSLLRDTEVCDFYPFVPPPVDWAIYFSSVTVIGSAALSTVVQAPDSQVPVSRPPTPGRGVPASHSRYPVVLSPPEYEGSLCFTAFLTVYYQSFSFYSASVKSQLWMRLSISMFFHHVRHPSVQRRRLSLAFQMSCWSVSFWIAGVFIYSRYHFVIIWTYSSFLYRFISLYFDLRKSITPPWASRLSFN